jgi:AraC-like DNA-binding protein
MPAVFATEDIRSASREEYWRHVLGEALVPLEPLGLPDRVTVGEVGAVGVGELSHRGQGGARRSAGHIRRSDPELCKVDVIASGHGVIEQGGREARLRPRDLTLVDLSRPATWAMSSIRCVAVTFPRSLLPLSADQVARLVAVPVRGDSGAGALISSLARQLPAHLDEWNARSGVRLGTAILDLLSVTLAGMLDRADQVPNETRQRALLQRIYAFIEQRLGDPALSPASVAAAQFISVRYLHKLFETEQSTAAEWIRQRRLERCARDLADPRRASETVAAIGARWGLPNPAHLSRLFRDAYGVTPSEYRAMGVDDPPPAPSGRYLT